MIYEKYKNAHCFLFNDSIVVGVPGSKTGLLKKLGFSADDRGMTPLSTGDILLQHDRFVQADMFFKNDTSFEQVEEIELRHHPHYAKNISDATIKIIGKGYKWQVFLKNVRTTAQKNHQQNMQNHRNSHGNSMEDGGETKGETQEVTTMTNVDTVIVDIASSHDIACSVDDGGGGRNVPAIAFEKTEKKRKHQEGQQQGGGK